MMDLYQTDKYEEKFESYPIEVDLNKLLNVQFSVKSNDSKLAIFGEKCWATPSDDPNDSNKHNIIANGWVME
jgi:hypothetical protein